MSQNNGNAQLIADGEGFLQTQEWEKAAAAFTKALDSNPVERAAVNGLVRALIPQRDFVRAEATLNRALDAAQDDAEYLRGLASVYEAQGEYDKAFAMFVKLADADACQQLLARLRIAAKYEDAERLMQRALAEFPDTLVILFERSSLFYAQDQYPSAIEYIEKVLPHAPTNEASLMLKAASHRLLAREGDASHLDVADKTLVFGLGEHPESEPLRLERIWLHYDRKEYEQAFNCAWQWENVEAAQNLLRTLLSTGNLTEAEKFLQETLARFPANPLILKEQGWHHFAQQQYDLALGSFIAANDGDGAASLLAQLRLKSLLEDAERLHAKALPHFAAHEELRYERASQLFVQKRYAEAVKIYDETLALSPQHRNAMYAKAQALRMLGRAGDPLKLAEAQQTLEAALALAPGAPDLLKERGWLEYQMQRYDAAFDTFIGIEDFESLRSLIYYVGTQGKSAESTRMLNEALRLFPARPEMLIARGEAHLAQKLYEEADADFSAVLKQDPQHKLALLGRIFTRRAQMRFKEAAELLREPLSLHPDDPDYMNEYGAQFYDQRAYEKAAEQFQKVLAQNDANEFALQWLLASLRWQGRNGKREKFEEAEKLMEKTLARFPDHEGFLTERGWLYYEQDKLTEADAAFAKAAAVALDPRQALYGRIDSLIRSKRGDEAARILDSMKQSYPDDPDVNSRAGWYYIGRNELDRAAQEFQSILARDEKSVLGLNGLASVHFSKGEFAEAEDKFHDVIALMENDPALHTNYAWALVRQGGEKKFTEAEKSCRHALQLDPNYPAAYGCLGVIAFRRGRVSDSEDYLLMSTRINKQDGSHTDLGALYVQMARYEEAEAALKTAIEINQYDTQALIQRGNLYLVQEKTKEAVREFRRAMVVDRWSEEAARMLATALMRAGEYDEAERVLRDAIRRLDEKKRWQLHLRLSELLVSLGDEKKDTIYYEDALAQASIAKRLNRVHAEPYFHEGIVLAKLRHYSGAQSSFSQCVKLKDDHHDAQRNLRIVRSKLREERALHSGSKLGAAIVGLSAAIQLIALWVIYLKSGRVSETMLTVMIPILLGLIVISLLLPVLVKLKLPGLEAELSQSQQKDTISSGPKGEIGFGSSSSISSPKAH